MAVKNHYFLPYTQELCICFQTTAFEKNHMTHIGQNSNYFLLD